MDYVKPADVASAMVNAGRSKLALAPLDLVIRGGLAGAILAAATSLAITGAVQTSQPLVGALIFPVGLILIVLLGLDLVTGSFGLLPLPLIENDTDSKTMLASWGWVFLGNLIGSVVYGGLLAIALTNFGATAPVGVAAKIIAIAEAKTTGYEALGYRRPHHRLRQGDPLQLDGLPRHRRRHDHLLDDRQDRLRLHAGLHLLRPGLRALGGEHVHHPDRHDDGRQGERRAMVAVESDSGHARQSGRRFRVHRACALHHPQAADGCARAADRADAGTR